MLDNPFIVIAIAACGGLIVLLLIIRVIGKPTVKFALDLWDWAIEQGVLGKLLYIAAWITMFPVMLVFCIAGGLVLQLAERRRRGGTAN